MIKSALEEGAWPEVWNRSTPFPPEASCESYPCFPAGDRRAGSASLQTKAEEGPYRATGKEPLARHLFLLSFLLSHLTLQKCTFAMSVNVTFTTSFVLCVFLP